MSERALHALAHEAGLSARWTDAYGEARTVAQESIEAALTALGFRCDSSKAIAASRGQIAETKRALPAMAVVVAGGRIMLPQHGIARLRFEDGTKTDLDVARDQRGQAFARAPNVAGYHKIELGNRELPIAIAPKTAFHVSGVRPWGIAVQIYSLPKGTTSEFGDFAALGNFAEVAGAAGADALAISPTHALLPRALRHFSPYSPSSRLFINPVFASARRAAKQTPSAIIDWSDAYPRKLRDLKRAFERMGRNASDKAQFDRYVKKSGAALLQHARFEVLAARFEQKGISSWRQWPAEFRNSQNAAVRQLKPDHRDVAFNLFLQWRAELDLTEVQKRARSAGMTIGLIADLAVGTDPDGCDAWRAPDDLLAGLSIGAPADRLGPDGQGWGLTALSPHALRRTGYKAFIDMLRATMRCTGGIRIDHAMSMERLWIIPDGMPPSAGVYLSYPRSDLMNLLALESVRNRAIVIAEDLGTVPPRFRGQLERAEMSGMRVLWFERTGDGDFKTSSTWSKNACAMTSTHDLPTVSGWWRGRDIDWREKLSKRKVDGAGMRKERAIDRRRLWKALAAQGCVSGPMPNPKQGEPVLDGAIRLVAQSNCKVALFPFEDIAGAIEQPNIPGTVAGHPNWSRRYPEATTERPAFKRRLAVIADERPKR